MEDANLRQGRSSQGDSRDLSIPLADETSKLDALAARIQKRDQDLDEVVRWVCFQNGCDLREAKELLGHGNFGPWCKAKLHYTKRKAEMLMSAAKMFEPLVKSESFSLLPPVSVAYALAAPSCPPELRDEFLPRLLAGDTKAGREFRRALKAHRDAAKASSSAASALAGEKALQPAATSPFRQEVDSRRPGSTLLSAATGDGDLRQETARAAALSLLVDELDCEIFNRLLEHATNAGLGKVFAARFEADLAAAQRAGGLIRAN